MYRGAFLSLFLPTVSVGKATDITPELIRAMDANAILLDVDNTLALHGSQTPFPGTVEWAKHMRKAGIRLVLVSNNFKKRVEPFAAKYGLPFLSLSLKPFPAAYHRAVRRLGVEPGRPWWSATRFSRTFSVRIGPASNPFCWSPRVWSNPFLSDCGALWKSQSEEKSRKKAAEANLQNKG